MDNKSGKIGKEAIATAKKDTFKWQEYLIANFKTVIGLTAVLILALGYFSVLKPKYDAINKQAAEVAVKEDEKSALISKLKKLEKVKKQFEEINPADLEKIDDILPVSPGKDELLSQLESLVLRNGLLLTSLQIEEVKEARRLTVVETEEATAGSETAKTEEPLSPDIGKIKITMDIAGTDYENLKKILNVMENNVRLLDVTKLIFSPDSTKTSVEMFAYYLKSSK